MSVAEKSTEEIAYHEAGHAVMAYVSHIRFTKISIEEDGYYLGQVVLDTRDIWAKHDSKKYSKIAPTLRKVEMLNDSRPRLEKHIMIGLAGKITECSYKGEPFVLDKEDFAKPDFEEAFELVKIFSSDDDVETLFYFKWLEQRTKNLFTIPVIWAAVEAIANALLERKKLGYIKARKIIKGALEKWKISSA